MHKVASISNSVVQLHRTLPLRYCDVEL